MIYYYSPFVVFLFQNSRALSLSLSLSLSPLSPALLCRRPRTTAFAAVMRIRNKAARGASLLRTRLLLSVCLSIFLFVYLTDCFVCLFPSVCITHVCGAIVGWRAQRCMIICRRMGLLKYTRPLWSPATVKGQVVHTSLHIRFLHSFVI
jgi:hypothetical protein